MDIKANNSAILIKMLEAKRNSFASNCKKKKVGCVITDEKFDTISEGYNEMIIRTPLINSICTCEGPCMTVHAEQAALIDLDEVDRAHKIFITLSPCLVCVKSILCAGIKEVYFLETHKDSIDQSYELLTKAEVEVYGLEPNS